MTKGNFNNKMYILQVYVFYVKYVEVSRPGDVYALFTF